MWYHEKMLLVMDMDAALGELCIELAVYRECERPG
jgi:hypothetical protein